MESQPLHEYIEDSLFRRAVELIDLGDAAALREHLRQNDGLITRRVAFENGNYFRNPGLLEFIAENPVRHGTLPPNIVQIARVLLDAGAKDDQASLNEALTLVSTGRVARESGMQIPLIDLLCKHGAVPDHALLPALAHREFDAVEALLRRGAHADLTTTAGLGRTADFSRLLPHADAQERHRALAIASQFGHTAIVSLLLHAGEDPNRYNPEGVHAHSTPLHQAAAGGHDELVRLLVARGARLDAKDTLWHATPAEWARHEGKTAIAEYLRNVAK